MATLNSGENSPRKPTVEAIQAAYSHLAAQKNLFLSATLVRNNTDAALKLERATATYAGLEGTNEASRSADLYRKTAKQTEAFLTADAAYEVAKVNCEIAQIAVDELKWSIRLLALNVEEE